jgi:calcium binding protein 39
LVSGIQQNLDALLRPPPSSASASSLLADAGAAATAGAVAAATEPTAAADDEASDPSKFLAARLSRLRFLLYDERRVTSQQYEATASSSSSPFRGGAGGPSSAGGALIRVAPAVGRKQAPAVASSAVQSFASAAGSGAAPDLAPRLLENMTALPFETRKHVAAIFNYLLVSGLEGSDAALYRPPMAAFCEYVESRFDRILEVIVAGHAQQSNAPADVALHFGSLYRSCLRHPSLYQQLVRDAGRVERFVFPFLDTYVHYSDFDVASDAMESVRAVFLAGQQPLGDAGRAPLADGGEESDDTPEGRQQAMAAMAAEFMTRDYDAVWNDRYNPKLLSPQASYMTRRVALQILSSVLLTRTNYNVMIRYVDSRSNLILVMNLLRDTSPHITLDAWQVFKVFVANPNKPEDVIRILRDNKVKLCRYLETLHQDREETDTQFRDEKALIIATIEAL